jgi:signal transduction histidine kinase
VQLVLVIGGIALLSVLVTTVLIASRTTTAIESTITQRAEAEATISAALTDASLMVESWVDLMPLVDDLATEYNARIALDDLDGRRLVESEPGVTAPLVGVVDPFGPLGIDTSFETVEADMYTELLTACFGASGVEFEVDVDGFVYPFEDFEQLPAIDACYAEVSESVFDAVPVGLADPALLYISFETDPAIPWLAVFVASTFVVLLAGVAAVVISGIMSRPITRLATAAHAIRRGDLGVRVDVTSPTEIADLAVSFNEMAASLESVEERRKRLTSNIAHELRSPVTNILGHMDAIVDGVIEGTATEYEIVIAEAERLASLIDDLQVLAALDEDTLVLERHHGDVVPLVRSAVRARGTRATEAGVTIDIATKGACEAEFDSMRLGQVFGNILDNAIEFTPADGSIDIVIDGDDQWVTVTITDSGPGIEKDLLPAVFDRFRRADGARTPGSGGQGLGLAIARGIARAHGGDVVATNAQDAGGCFVVTIPTVSP